MGGMTPAVAGQLSPIGAMEGAAPLLVTNPASVLGPAGTYLPAGVTITPGVGAASGTGWLAKGANVLYGAGKEVVKTFGSAALMGGLQSGTKVALKMGGDIIGGAPEPSYGVNLPYYDPAASEGGFAGGEAPRAPAPAPVKAAVNLPTLAIGGAILYYLVNK